MKGERQLTTSLGYEVYFDKISTIQFVDNHGVTVVQLDPTDLSAIYGAYRQMEREYEEDKSLTKEI